MTNRVELIGPSGTPLHVHDDPTSTDPVLVADSLHRVHGKFTSQKRTSAGTTILAAPELTQELVLTDLIVSTDKVNAATLVVRWTDDTETINIFDGTATDAPINLAIAFAGRWAGWRNARIEMVTAGALAANVAIGYYKIPKGQTYAEWDAER
jgi:hypothetical protein